MSFSDWAGIQLYVIHSSSTSFSLFFICHLRPRVLSHFKFYLLLFSFLVLFLSFQNLGFSKSLPWLKLVVDMWSTPAEKLFRARRIFLLTPHELLDARIGLLREAQLIWGIVQAIYEESFEGEVNRTHHHPRFFFLWLTDFLFSSITWYSSNFYIFYICYAFSGSYDK